MADPNPNSPMNSEAAKLFENDRVAYNQRVREWVQKPAKSVDASGSWSGDLGKDDDGKAAPAATPSSVVSSATSETAALGISHEFFNPVVIDLSDDEGLASKRVRTS